LSVKMDFSFCVVSGHPCPKIFTIHTESVWGQGRPETTNAGKKINKNLRNNLTPSEMWQQFSGPHGAPRYLDEVTAIVLLRSVNV